MTVDGFTLIIGQLLPEPHAGLLAGMLFGTKASIQKDLYDALVATGTLHIAALSGMNITILTTIVAGALLRVVNRRIAGLLTIVIIIGFVWFVGAGPSVVRAAIMGSVALLATVFGRQYWGFLTYWITIGLMLLVRPSWIADLSFQLSALATLGIILFGPQKEMNVVKSDLHTTLAAQVFTIPLILLTFHRISLVSPITNVLIGWVIPPVTTLGLACALAGWIFLPLAYPLAWTAWIFLEYMILIITRTADIPLSYIAW